MTSGPASPEPVPTRPNRTTDHLANERTFLAWIRTSLGLIGLGFVLARMGLFLRQLSGTVLPGRATGHAPQPGGEFLVAGVVLLLFGVALCPWSAWLHERNRAMIDAGRYEPSRLAIAGLTLLVGLGGLVVAGLVAWRAFEAG